MLDARLGRMEITAATTPDSPPVASSRPGSRLKAGKATIALNDEKNPTPIDVASEVLRHKDIATTRRHYAPTKSDRKRAALVAMTVR